MLSLSQASAYIDGLNCVWSSMKSKPTSKLYVNHLVSYKTHKGGGYYVSITSGFNCIDICTFYVPYGQTDPKPTRRGIALRLGEWMQNSLLYDRFIYLSMRLSNDMDVFWML